MKKVLKVVGISGALLSILGVVSYVGYKSKKVDDYELPSSDDLGSNNDDWLDAHSESYDCSLTDEEFKNMTGVDKHTALDVISKRMKLWGSSNAGTLLSDTLIADLYAVCKGDDITLDDEELNVFEMIMGLTRQQAIDELINSGITDLTVEDLDMLTDKELCQAYADYKQLKK